MTTEVSIETPKRKRNWIFTILKIVASIVALMLVIFTVMANLGGSNDTLKRSIEEFITDNTRYNAHVGKLNSMTFFPDISFDFEDVELRTKDTFDAVMHVGKVQLAFGFWDVMATTGKIKVLNVENIQALGGVLLSVPMDISNISISESVDGPRLESKGTIGGQPEHIALSMNSSGIGKGKKYSFGSERQFDILLGDVNFQGKILMGKSAGLVFEDLEIFSKDKKISSGNISLVKNRNQIDITGNLLMEEHKTDVSPEITIKGAEAESPFQIEGAVNSKKFHVADFNGNSGYAKAMASLENVFGASSTPANNLKLNTPVFQGSDVSETPYDGPLPLKIWHIDISAMAH